MTMEEMTRQMAAAVENYPKNNPDRACADCRVFPPFDIFQFNRYDKSKDWELTVAREDYTGWVTYSVIPLGPHNVKICPKCAKKRTMI